MGAKIIEKHFILDNNLPGPDNMVSLNPTQLKSMIDGIRKVEKALTHKSKIVYDKEIQIRNWARRSVVSIRDITIGEKFTSENIWSKRPGTGIPSYKMSEVINKKAKHDIKNNILLDWNDIE